MLKCPIEGIGQVSEEESEVVMMKCMMAAHKEQEYDKLADLVRSSFDMKKIYEILEAGI